MDRPRLPEGRGVRVADADTDRGIARRRVVLAVDDVADAADREAEREARRGRVGAEADRYGPAPQRDDETTEHATDRRAPYRDAAAPDLRDQFRVRGVAAGDARAAAPAVKDVEDARAEDPADDAPERHRVRVGLGHALHDELHRHRDTGEDPDRGEDAVPRECDRAEVNARVEIDDDHCG